MRTWFSTKVRSKVDFEKIHKHEIKQHRQKISGLRRLCSSDNNIIPINITDFQLVEFLNSVNYDEEKAKRVLRVHYKFKRENEALFSMRSPFNDDIQEVWTVLNMFSLPTITNGGEKVVYFGLKNPDPLALKIIPSMKLVTMAIEASLIAEGLYPGYVTILDATGLSIQHMPLSAIPAMKKFLYYIQEGIPINITQVHVINPSAIVTKIYNILKPFLKQDLIRILKFHSEGIENFYSSVPKELLPQELGGTLQLMQIYQSEFKEKVDSLEDWYQLEEQQRQLRLVA